RGLVFPNAECVSGNGPHKRVAILKGCSQRCQVSRINDVVIRSRALSPAPIEVLFAGWKVQRAVVLDWRMRLRTATCRLLKKQSSYHQDDAIHDSPYSCAAFGVRRALNGPSPSAGKTASPRNVSGPGAGDRLG